MPARKDSGEGGESGRLALRLAGAGLEFGAVVALFVVLGWWLDSQFGTSPWLLLMGLLISFLGGVYKLWRLGRESFD